MSGFIGLYAGGAGITLLDTQTVTRGQSNSGGDPNTFLSGFRTTGALGSISDGTSNVYGGATISDLYFYELSYVSPPSGIVTRQVIWRIDSVVSNSGWQAMLVGTAEFTRASATFTTGGAYSQWVWSLAIDDPFVSANDPFTATTTVKWY